MQNKNTLIILLIIALAVVGFIAFKNSAKAPVIDNTPPTTTMPREGITGNKNNAGDLISFSIWPGSKVHGLMSYRGSIKNAYFFEANIGIKILDVNKNVLKSSNTMATTDWMTAEPVSFEGNIDFTGLPAGPAYFRIQNDNASGDPVHDKWIDIPVIIQ
jgi:hypothetical protein